MIRQQVERRKQPRDRAVAEDGAAAGPRSAETKDLKDDLDDLLDEIDGLLEENAEEFVKSFVQKGGE